MTTKTLSERLDTAKYNTLRLFWAALNREWQDDAVMNCLPDAVLSGVADALGEQDSDALLVLVDQAQNAGVSLELCSLTRTGLKHFQR